MKLVKIAIEDIATVCYEKLMTLWSFSKYGEAENPNDFLALTDFTTIEIECASDTFTRFVLLCMHIAIAMIIYSCPE